MTTLRIWTLAARPRTLPASLGLTILGTTLAFSQGFFYFPLFCATLLTALGIQITTNFANDYFDFLKGADTPERKGPTRVTQSGLVSLEKMRKALLVSLTITAILGCYLVWHGGLPIALLMALSLILAIIYTGGPFPLAYLGLGDLFVFLFFGPIAVFGAYFLQVGSFSLHPIWAGIGAGALSTAILAVNNIRDIEEDKIAFKKTLVVRFGKKFGQIEYVSCLIVAALIPFFFLKTHPFCLLSLFFALPALYTTKTLFSYRDPRELNEVLGKTGQILLMYCLLFCIGWTL